MSIFETSAELYDNWFEKYPLAYESEIAAVQNALPKDWSKQRGMEIGIGTGRFSAPFGISEGIEPAAAMREIAEAKGIHALNGKAEKLPFDNNIFDFALMVTTICFVDDPEKSCQEAHRILKPDGSLIIGIVNKNSPLGQEYEKRRQSSRFYKNAKFFSVEDIIEILTETGFTNLRFYQTLFTHPDKLLASEPVMPGYGQGSFVVISGTKPDG